MMRVVIVDDEPLARKGLAIRLSELADIEIVAQCANGRDALEKIPTLQPDLVFLDIQMPALNGFQVINELRINGCPMPLIVFVTAYDNYAIKAFESHALDYVLKPVDDGRLAAAVQKAREHLDLQHLGEHSQKLVNLVADFTGDDCEDILRRLAEGEPVSGQNYPNVLAIKDGSEVKRVDIADIQWIDAAGDYMCVHTHQDTHILRRTMKELIAELDPKIFLRVHRSVIVNVKCVSKLVSQTTGEYQLVLNNGTEVKVSRSHREQVKKMIHQAAI